MAIDPIDDARHLFTGRSSPRVSPGNSTPGLDPNPNARMYW